MAAVALRVGIAPVVDIAIRVQSGVPRPFFAPADRAFRELVKARHVEKMIRTADAHHYIIQDCHPQL
ncbi:hypothetical protein [Sorangium sp. So ce1078]|uniref:hypothetical protein n=1 Tax=Sorangium sp. So ce1078 TaxID=3133329 RepID=UPI003F5E6096